MRIIIINGPNLNLLGIRETDIYGEKSFDDYLVGLKEKFPQHKIEYFQSNHEGELIDKIQEVGFSYDAIILNAGGYTHTSVALADAVASINTPVYEVHISNIYARENYRKISYISQHAKAVISGFGIDVYELAVRGGVRDER
ncbi:MAG: type II 3-dehydroquinate dehydratase [Bacteroidota bacterium]|nr:type II 3-dehydroquinate dehydratase [Bacteroidota bacterium]